MENLKIFLQRPWKFSDSPYYDYLTKNISDNIEYINIRGKHQGIVSNIGRFKILNFLKRFIKISIRKIYPSLPNAHLTKTDKHYDIIHCAHCLSLNKSPWIMDIEYVNQFWAGGIIKKGDNVLKILRSKYCKKILAWTEWTKKGILENFPEIENKIEVIYPAIPIQNIRRRKDKKVRLLFVSRRFYFKGGLHALEVMDRLTKKYENVEATIISEVPEEVKGKYSNNKIKFINFIQKSKLFSDIYPNTDILIYPSYTDTFGFVILEALSFGIPTITVNGMSRGELVIDGENGFLINEPKWDLEDLKKCELETIKKMEEKTEKLIKNKKLREFMSSNCIEEVGNGRFSIKNRNMRLERIYSEALNDNN